MQIPTGSKSFHALNPHLFLTPQHSPGSATGSAAGAGAGTERENVLHDQIEAFCRARGWLYRHDRMDKPTTGTVGFPDFAIFMPGARTVFLECKRPGGKATPQQLASLAHARRLGFVAEIVETMYAALQAIDRAQQDGTA